jgi:hypothetical protein
VKGVRTAGEDAVRRAMREGLGPFIEAAGSVAISNRFCWTTARPG